MIPASATLVTTLEAMALPGVKHRFHDVHGRRSPGSYAYAFRLMPPARGKRAGNVCQSGDSSRVVRV
jgi:hypothetical protein